MEQQPDWSAKNRRRMAQVANLQLIHPLKNTMAFQQTVISSGSEARVPHPSKQLVLSPGWQNPLHLAIKRAFDVTVSAVLLFLLAPVFLLAAIAVKLSSNGPVFYRWKVVGRGGQPFTGYKFRSMVANADALRDELASRNEMKGPVFKIAQDPRITNVGAC